MKKLSDIDGYVAIAHDKDYRLKGLGKASMALASASMAQHRTVTGSAHTLSGIDHDEAIRRWVSIGPKEIEYDDKEVI